MSLRHNKLHLATRFGHHTVNDTVSITAQSVPNSTNIQQNGSFSDSQIVPCPVNCVLSVSMGSMNTQETELSASNLWVILKLLVLTPTVTYNQDTAHDFQSISYRHTPPQSLQGCISSVPYTSLYPIKSLRHNKLHLATRFGHHTVNDIVSIIARSVANPTKIQQNGSFSDSQMVPCPPNCVLNVSMGSMNIQETELSTSILWVVPKLLVLSPTVTYNKDVAPQFKPISHWCIPSQTLQRRKSCVPYTSLYPIKCLRHSKLHLPTRFGHHEVTGTVSITARSVPCPIKMQQNGSFSDSQMVSCPLNCVFNVSLGSIKIKKTELSTSILWVVPKLLVLSPTVTYNQDIAPNFQSISYRYTPPQTLQRSKICVPYTSFYPIKSLRHNKLHLAISFGCHTVNDTVSVTGQSVPCHKKMQHNG
jgi:hypothetical protein